MRLSPEGLSDEAITAYAQAAADYLGLPIPEKCWPGVITNLRALREHGAMVMGFPLDEEVQTGSVFQP